MAPSYNSKCTQTPYLGFLVDIPAPGIAEVLEKLSQVATGECHESKGWLSFTDLDFPFFSIPEPLPYCYINGEISPDQRNANRQGLFGLDFQSSTMFTMTHTTLFAM